MAPARVLSTVLLIALAIVRPISGIVDGDLQAITGAPFAVSLSTEKGGLICGGALLNSRWVVTSAYCLKEVSINDLIVRVGSENVDSGGSKSYVSTVVEHHNYDDRTKEYNIALLKLRNEFRKSETVGYINLWEENKQLYEGLKCYIVGYGSTQARETRPSWRLRTADTKIINRDSCKNTFNSNTFDNTMTCMVGDGRSDGCNGDAGSPVVCNGKLAGVISWGDGCGQNKRYIVFTNMEYSNVRDWVDRNI